MTELDQNGDGNVSQFEAGGRKVVLTGNADTHYAAMLMFVIKRHLPSLRTLRQFNRLLELGMLAWNLSITKKIDPDNFPEVRDDHIFSHDFDDEQLSAIERMMDLKQDLFGDYNLFIIAGLVTNTDDGGYEVMVKTGEYDDFDFVPEED
jgi:hypothetical protein